MSSTWSWADVLGAAQAQAQDLAVKAQEIAELAKKEAGNFVQQYASTIESADATWKPSGDNGLADIIPSSYSSGPVSSSLDLVYITENIIAMAFPYDPAKSTPAEGGNNMHSVSRYLNRKHGGHYMVWNISEETYDNSFFDNQVLEYKFPGHPAPPLGLLFKICTSVESWLDADERNVAVIHCLTGKGRTAALISCILTWIGEMNSPMEALQYVADRKAVTIDTLTIPSQRRYVQYFSNMLDGVKPRSEPLLLRRVIMNTIPNFGKCTSTADPSVISEGCCPYVQLFKCGRLIATATPPTAGDDHNYNSGSTSIGNKKNIKLKWVDQDEGSVPFQVDCALQGDILLRLRHATVSGARTSMLRAAFHTGYVPYGVLRFYKAQLDGANEDDRFADDFFIDLVFATIEKQSTSTANSPDLSQVTPSSQSIMAVGVPSDSGLIIDSSSSDRYEQSIHRDSRFWEAISTRKLKAKKRKSRKFISNIHEQFSIGDDSGSNKITGAASDDDLELSFHKSNVQKSIKSKPETDINLLDLSQLSDEDLILQLSGAVKDEPKTAPIAVNIKFDEDSALVSTKVKDISDMATITIPTTTDSVEASNAANLISYNILDELTKELAVKDDANESDTKNPSIASFNKFTGTNADDSEIHSETLHSSNAFKADADEIKSISSNTNQKDHAPQLLSQTSGSTDALEHDSNEGNQDVSATDTMETEALQSALPSLEDMVSDMTISKAPSTQAFPAIDIDSNLRHANDAYEASSSDSLQTNARLVDYPLAQLQIDATLTTSIAAPPTNTIASVEDTGSSIIVSDLDDPSVVSRLPSISQTVSKIDSIPSTVVDTEIVDTAGNILNMLTSAEVESPKKTKSTKTKKLKTTKIKQEACVDLSFASANHEDKLSSFLAASFEPQLINTTSDIDSSISEGGHVCESANVSAGANTSAHVSENVKASVSAYAGDSANVIDSDYEPIPTKPHVVPAEADESNIPIELLIAPELGQTVDQTPPATSGISVNDDDDLAEMEKYLNSLSST